MASCIACLWSNHYRTHSSGNCLWFYSLQIKKTYIYLCDVNSILKWCKLHLFKVGLTSGTKLSRNIDISKRPVQRLSSQDFTSFGLTIDSRSLPFLLEVYLKWTLNVMVDWEKCKGCFKIITLGASQADHLRQHKGISTSCPTLSIGFFITNEKELSKKKRFTSQLHISYKVAIKDTTLRRT